MAFFDCYQKSDSEVRKVHLPRASVFVHCMYVMFYFSSFITQSNDRKFAEKNSAAVAERILIQSI